MKTMKMLLAAGVLCTSSLLLSSFTDSSYKSTNKPSQPAQNGKVSSYSWSGSGSDELTPDSKANDRFELNIFDQKDEQALYDVYGYSRGDLHHVFKYNFDPKTVQTFRGDVVKVTRARYPDGDCYVIIVLRTDEGDYLVNLGPVWYIDESGLVINEGDGLQVRGSKVRMNGRFLIISAEIKKDGEVLKFRDAQGQSIWVEHPGKASEQQKMQQKTNPNAPSSHTNPSYSNQINPSYSNPSFNQNLNQ